MGLLLRPVILRTSSVVGSLIPDAGLLEVDSRDTDVMHADILFLVTSEFDGLLDTVEIGKQSPVSPDMLRVSKVMKIRALPSYP